MSKIQTSPDFRHPLYLIRKSSNIFKIRRFSNLTKFLLSQKVCPKCGAPCENINKFVSSARFVKCDKCAHFFVVLSEQDTKKAGAAKADPELGTAKAGLGALPNRKPPPPPKKIFEYLVRVESSDKFSLYVI